MLKTDLVHLTSIHYFGFSSLCYRLCY